MFTDVSAGRVYLACGSVLEDTSIVRCVCNNMSNVRPRGVPCIRVMRSCNELSRISIKLAMSDPCTVDNSPYPGQFSLGPDFIERLSRRRFQVAGSLTLTLHSDLAYTRVTDGVRELTLIGHMLDPRVASAGNEEILLRLLSHYANRATLIDATAGLGGRWVLIAVKGEEKFLFNDALGLRQVSYVDPQETGAVWAVSQPGLVAEMLALPLDPEAERFMQSYAFRSNPEYRWPGEATAFTAVRHLLPNHWLDLNSGTSHRYWPAHTVAALEPDVAVERLSVLLPGMIRAAAQRFDLALALTAGIDSRLVLSAAKEIRDRVSFVTVQQNGMLDDHPDLTVPARLLQGLGLPHEVIRVDATMTADFSRMFKRGVYLAHEHYGPDAEAILRRFSRTKATLTGSGAEVGRCSFRKDLPFSDRRAITPANLARLQCMGREPFALRHFERWLKDATPCHNMKLLDLFEWEQGHGNWLAMTQLEFDIAWREIITPYNCREVLTTLLGVDERYRRAPDYSLFLRLIERLWPEALQEPINPKPRQNLLHLLKGTARSLPKYWS